MKIGLIDVDGHNFPNLCLMKLSAYHKARGDAVEWYKPLESGRLDRVYMSKVFSFTPDYPYNVNAEEIIKGGSGYRIRLENGREVYDAENDKDLPPEIEHIYPDYSIYYGIVDGIENTAYGFLSRGCPRGCSFCHVACKEGRRAYKVADLDEFWNGQKYIKLLDPNITAVPECLDLFDQLAKSGARVDFTQGIDIRLTTKEKVEKLKQIKVERIHFAWDRYQDKAQIVPKFREFAEVYAGGRGKLMVYVLCNFDTTIDQDLERVYTLRDLGYSPFIMLYDKEHARREMRQLQRYVNNRYIFNSPECRTFEEYQNKKEDRDENQLKLF